MKSILIKLKYVSKDLKCPLIKLKRLLSELKRSMIECGKLFFGVKEYCLVMRIEFQTNKTVKNCGKSG
jgi:hypothetical protein